jgi:hypothetical protein
MPILTATLTHERWHIQRLELCILGATLLPGPGLLPRKSIEEAADRSIFRCVM